LFFLTIHSLQHFLLGNRREIGYEKKITRKQHKENKEHLTSSKINDFLNGKR